MAMQIDMTLYLKQLKNRYKQANKKAKALILNEFCSTSGYHRKHAIRLLTNVEAPLVGAPDVTQVERAKVERSFTSLSLYYRL